MPNFYLKLLTVLPFRIVLGDLVCLVLTVVLGILGGLISILLGGILAIVIGIVGSLTGVFAVFPECVSHWPTGLGGSYVIV